MTFDVQSWKFDVRRSISQNLLSPQRQASLPHPHPKQARGKDGRDESGEVGGGGVVEEVVGGVFFLGDFMHDAGAVGESGDAGGTEEGVYGFICQAVYEFGQEDAGCGGEYEGDQADSKH